MKQKATQLKLIIIIGAAILTVTLFIVFFVHLATHGRLSIATDRTITQIFLYSRDENLSYNHIDTDPHGDIPTGHYLININFADNQLYSEEITIEGFYATTTISVPDLPAISYTKALDATWGKYLPISESSYISYYPFYGTQVISDSNEVVSGFTPLSVHDAFYNQNYTLLTSSTFSGKTGEDDRVAFFHYDQSTSLNYHISTKSLPKQTTISHGQDGFYFINNRILYSFTPSGEATTPIPSNIRYSMFGATPITSKNATHIAFLDGNDYETPPAEEVQPLTSFEDLADTFINIFPINRLDDNSQKISIPITKSSNIHTISISPNSKNIAIQYDTFIEFYNIETKQRSLSVMAGVSANDMIWISDDDVIFLNRTKILSIQKVNLIKSSIATILAPNNINISELCGLKDNLLYFTAFEQGNTEQTLPGGYYVDISTI